MIRTTYNTHQEGVFVFWMTVDNAIMTSLIEPPLPKGRGFTFDLNKVELNNLKSYKANAQTV